MLLPFQVVLASGTAINWVRLYNYNTGAYTTIISFDEYEVAPGYMGAVTFTIPLNVTGKLAE